MTNTILAILFGLIAVVCVAFLLMYFVKRSASAVSDKVSEKFSGNGLVLSVSRSSTGSRLVVSVSPIEAFGNDPEFPNEPMGGGEIPFDLLDNFFKGTLPEPQMEYIEGKLRDRGVSLTRKVEGGTASEKPSSEEPLWNNRNTPEDQKEQTEKAPEQTSSPEATTQETSRTESSEVSGKSADLPFEMGKIEEAPVSGTEKPAEEAKGTVTPEQTEKTEVTEGQPEGTLLPDEVESPFDAADAVDNEPEFEITSGKDIPIEVMDYLVAPGDEAGKVDRYYCACRLGIAMDFNFLPENKERNVARLRSIREQCDKLPVSEVLSTFINCSGLFGGSDGYVPKFEATVVGGPSFARVPVEA